MTNKIHNQPLFFYSLLMILFLAIFSSCSQPAQNPTQADESPPISFDETQSPSSTPTTERLTTLKICTASLPEDLFPLSGPDSTIKRTLLNMIYEAPFSEEDGALSPLILSAVPTQNNGGLKLEPTAVEAGQPVVDYLGQITVLKPGVQVRPSGCQRGDCSITWDGDTPLEMDQMVVIYQLRDDLTWSDSTLVSAEDSVFSFKLAAAIEGNGLDWAEDRTQEYLAIDQHTIQWVGLPGFATADLERFFWKPLPSHIYQQSASWGELQNNDLLNSSPVGYGPFVVSEWGDGILDLKRNPYYFQKQDGYPKLDQINFIAIDGDTQEGWNALKAGQCDVLDSSLNLLGSPDVVDQIRGDERFKLLTQEGQSWIQLVFGIKPASYDDFYSPGVGDRPDYFGDPRTRQAIMSCLDREGLHQTLFGDMGRVWPSILPADHSQLSPGENGTFDPIRGAELLQEIGWVDHDGDPATALRSWNVVNVPAGEPLSLELVIPSNDFYQGIAEAVQSDLAACGIDLRVESLPAEAVYAPGPGGPLFGRQFDLTLLSWQPMPGGDCQFYQSWQMPTDDNNWIGTNIAGLQDAVYDQACAGAMLALSDEYEMLVRQSELVYLEALPAIPLFSIPEVMVVPVNGCSEKDISTVSDFYAQIANFGIGVMCP